MKLHTNDNKTYDVKWAEYWEDPKRLILAETYDGNVIEIELENFNKIEEK